MALNISRFAEHALTLPCIGSSPSPRSLTEVAEMWVNEERFVREIIRKAGVEGN
jgi:hypothetical protein